MFLSALLDVVVPPRCLACGAPAGPVCGGCRRALRPLRDACPRCAQPLPCRRCPARDAPWDRAVAAVQFEGPGRALVHALKFHQRLAAADAMAAALAVALGPLPPGAALVPVPAHDGRVRRAGFDHAVVLAAALARRAGAPLHPRLLHREGAVLRQVDAQDARTRRGPGRVCLTVADQPVPSRVVLVDDVHTTGATLCAAAAVLRAAGAGDVTAATYARAVLGEPSLDPLSKM